MEKINLANTYMEMALQEARSAAREGEVPVGAVIVFQGQIIAKAHNQVELLQDPTAHAEMLAITAATNFIGNKNLKQCQVFVSLEPCPMCAGALFHSRIGSLHYAASDPKQGFSNFERELLHPRTQIHSGNLKEKSISLLQEFFQARR